MADKLVQPLVLFTVQKLLNMLMEEGTFLGEVKGQVEEMEKELHSIQTYLIDADRRRGEGDQSVTKVVVEIRELAYNAEDVIATFVVKVAGGGDSSSGRKQTAVCFDFKRYLSYVKSSGTRHHVGKEIEDINKQIASLTGRLERYKVKQTPVAMNPRKEYPTPIEGIVVGLDDQVRTMVDVLKDKTRERIVSVYGMGGLGKTTFSKKIVHQLEIKHHFDHIAWVCVSQQFDPIQVWREILLQFDSTNQEKKATRNLTESELVTKLHSTQMEKKCLMVLDDIWEQQDWNSLCHAFPRATASGSKIVLTTRKKDVVSHAKGIECLLYPLPFLDEMQCQELLEKKLSPKTEDMRNMIKEVVGRCGGLPLALVLVGGLLAEDISVNAWEKVSQDLSNSLNKGNDREWGVQKVLALSYQDLPYNLKACFLYLSLFPEDCNIHAESLVQMWIAEGFVSDPVREGGTKTSFDVGLSYLNELVNRCMVQADISKLTRGVKSCRLHDLMRDFCRSKAREENFSQDIGLQKPIHSTYSSPLNTIRRIAVYFEDRRQHEEITSPCEQLNHVRSCLVHNWEEKSWDAITPLLKGFKFLKVLHLNIDVYDEEGQAEDIGKLIHLRYLCLLESYVVPSSLGNLVLLQTLKLTNPLCCIPDVLWKLKELKHLLLPSYWHIDPPSKLRLDGLSKLETLINFHTRCSDMADLATLPNLRKLVIQCDVSELGYVFEAPVFSKSDSLLQSSTFNITGDIETHEVHRHLCQVLACHRVLGFSLSGCVYEETSFLRNLNTNITNIILKGCGLKEDPMPSLGKMPNLQKLYLFTGSYIGKKMSMVAGSFPQLTGLYITDLEISEWEVEKGAMSCLSKLQIRACKELKKIPDGLRFIPTLEHLLIICPKLLTMRLRRGGEDFSKIQHVPNIKISTVKWHFMRNSKVVIFLPSWIFWGFGHKVDAVGQRDFIWLLCHARFGPGHSCSGTGG